MIKLMEQGSKNESKGFAVVVAGGDGQAIRPNRVQRIRGDHVGIIEVLGAQDARMLSTVGPNGLYEIRCDREGNQAKVTVTLYKWGARPTKLVEKVCDAKAVINGVHPSLFDTESNGALKRDLEERASLAVLRTFAEDTRDYSLEPLEAPVKREKKKDEQLQARAQMNAAPAPAKSEANTTNTGAEAKMGGSGIIATV